MIVSELIEKLQKLPPHNDVMIAFDMNIRMSVEIANTTNLHDYNETRQVVVLTDKEEWEDRQHWS